MQNYKYDKIEPIKLDADDIIVFLTDGITEAHAINEEQFGFNRTLDIIRSHQNATARQILEQLYQKVRSFTENKPQEDDITAVICKVNSSGT